MTLTGLIMNLTGLIVMVYFHYEKQIVKKLNKSKKWMLSLKLEVKIALLGLIITNFWRFLEFTQTPLGKRLIQTFIESFR